MRKLRKKVFIVPCGNHWEVWVDPDYSKKYYKCYEDFTSTFYLFLSQNL